MVHWEQTYNCGDDPILEQFVRQAMLIPTQPILIFSESMTANWYGLLAGIDHAYHI
jgi:hypothetical protein